MDSRVFVLGTIQTSFARNILTGEKCFACFFSEVVQLLILAPLRSFAQNAIETLAGFQEWGKMLN